MSRMRLEIYLVVASCCLQQFELSLAQFSPNLFSFHFRVRNICRFCLPPPKKCPPTPKHFGEESKQIPHPIFKKWSPIPLG